MVGPPRALTTTEQLSNQTTVPLGCALICPRGRPLDSRSGRKILRLHRLHVWYHQGRYQVWYHIWEGGLGYGVSGMIWRYVELLFQVPGKKNLVPPASASASCEKTARASHIPSCRFGEARRQANSKKSSPIGRLTPPGAPRFPHARSNGQAG
jgi:hypothetical protein